MYLSVDKVKLVTQLELELCCTVIMSWEKMYIKLLNHSKLLLWLFIFVYSRPFQVEGRSITWHLWRCCCAVWMRFNQGQGSVEGNDVWDWQWGGWGVIKTRCMIYPIVVCSTPLCVFIQCQNARLVIRGREEVGVATRPCIDIQSVLISW